MRALRACWPLVIISMSLFILMGYMGPTAEPRVQAQPFPALLLLSPELQKSLVAYWPFNEGAGERTADASAHGHEGQLKNGPTWAPGYIGQALRFDGLDDYVFVPYSPAFDLLQGLSIVLWAYLESDPDATGGNDWRLLLGRNGFRPYGLALEQNGKLTGSVYLDNKRQSVQSPMEIPAGEWVHIAFTYEAESGLLRLYINGQLIAEHEASSGKVEQIEGRALTISLPKPEGTQELRAWPGRLDEVQLYQRALKPAEVQTLFEGTPYNS